MRQASKRGNSQCSTEATAAFSCDSHVETQHRQNAGRIWTQFQFPDRPLKLQAGLVCNASWMVVLTICPRILVIEHNLSARAASRLERGGSTAGLYGVVWQPRHQGIFLSAWLMRTKF